MVRKGRKYCIPVHFDNDQTAVNNDQSISRIAVTCDNRFTTPPHHYCTLYLSYVLNVNINVTWGRGATFHATLNF